MFLYLMRHGEAKNRQEDPERGLTDYGVEEAKRIAGFFRSALVSSDEPARIDEIWHSGKKRAMQTAGIVSAAIEFQGTPEARDGLNPTDDVSIIADAIAKSKSEAVVIAGHLPFLSRLAGYLLCGDPDNEFTRFPCAGMLCLQGHITFWQLEWFVHPEIIT